MEKGNEELSRKPPGLDGDSQEGGQDCINGASLDAVIVVEDTEQELKVSARKAQINVESLESDYDEAASPGTKPTRSDLSAKVKKLRDKQAVQEQAIMEKAG